MTRRHRNVLLITADQWRGDCLSAVGHPVVRSPNLDALAAEGVLFEQHYANAVPCGPSRACLHTGMYLHNHRSGTNGTPLDRRFTNWALEVRRVGYDPALFGYTHTAPDPRYLTADDPRLKTDEGILPGIKPVVDMATHCGPWREWLKQFGYALPDDHGTTYGMRATTHDTPRCHAPRCSRRTTPTPISSYRARWTISALRRTASRAGRYTCRCARRIHRGSPPIRTTRDTRCGNCPDTCGATTSTRKARCTRGSRST